MVCAPAHGFDEFRAAVAEAGFLAREPGPGQGNSASGHPMFTPRTVVAGVYRSRVMVHNPPRRRRITSVSGMTDVS